METEPYENKPLPDYGKIIFLGIPLAFLAWVVSLFSIFPYCSSMKMSMTLSIAIAILFYMAFFLMAVKIPGFCKIDNCASSKDGTNKNVSTREAIFYLIVLVSLIPGAVISTYVAHKFDITNPKMAGTIGGLAVFPILHLLKNRFFKDVR